MTEERERSDSFFARAALVWAYGGHQNNGMALCLRGSYHTIRLAGLSYLLYMYISYYIGLPVLLI